MATTPPSQSQDPSSSASSASSAASRSESTSNASADSHSASSSYQTANNALTSSGNSSLTTGNIAGGAANNAGNAQSVSFDYPRMAPSTAQGSLAIAACGAGGNAGGSNTHGSAFLGLAWTPEDCKLLLAAQAYQAIGMPDAACEMVNGISSVQKRWKALGVPAPKCEVKPAPVVVPPAPTQITIQPATSNAATREEVSEVVDRAFKRAVGK
ncbi:MAG: hypothetical protein QM813_17040 [Verrucomicrobiota bacterium]